MTPNFDRHQPYADRRDAGQVLAGRLEHFTGRKDVVILALLRGGVPVAHEVARALDVPLGVFLVRKLGVPGHRELAMGAIASGKAAVEAVRATPPQSRRDIGELNLGQLVRQTHGSEAFLVAFTTHTGTVTAASNWNEPAQRKRVRPSMAGSYERLFHDAGVERFLLLLLEGPAREALREDRLERAIGVIYRPESERLSHYFRARLPEQFDAVLHIDQTAALEPLERWAHDEADVPETYPTGI